MRQKREEGGGGVCSRLGKCQNEILYEKKKSGREEVEEGGGAKWPRGVRRDDRLKNEEGEQNRV